MWLRTERLWEMEKCPQIKTLLKYMYCVCYTQTQYMYLRRVLIKGVNAIESIVRTFFELEDN
jgi:hypothetical protein